MRGRCLDIRLKVLIILILVAIIPNLVITYFVHQQAKQLIFQQEKDKLQQIAKVAAKNIQYLFKNQNIIGIYQRLPSGASKLNYLHNQLKFIGERFSNAEEDLGLSIYIKDLDALVVNAPEEKAGNWVGKSIPENSPSRRVIQTGQPVFEVLDVRRGTYLLYSEPIIIDGEVIGTVNSMQSYSNLTTTYIKNLDKFVLVGLLVCLAAVFLATGYLIYSLDTFTKEILQAINSLQQNPATQLPRAGGKIGIILKRLQEMATSLANFKNLIQVTLDRINTGVITVDNDGVITYCNKKINDIFKNKGARVVGCKYVEVIAEEFGINPGDLLLERTLKEGITDAEVKKRVGDERSFLYSTCVLTDWEGKRLGAVITLKDIDDLRKLEELQGKKEVGSVLREVAAELAHEVKNPLTTIKGFLQLAYFEGKQLPDEHFKLVLDELDRTLNLISEFRDLNRKEEIECTALNPAEIIRDMIALLKNEAVSKNVTIETELDDSFEVCWDEKKTKQVLLNLMRNGFEAMPDGGVLRVAMNYQEDRELVRITVADTGVGMDKETLEKLGQPFFTTKEGGTGLGLTLTKSFLNQMGGTLEVVSQKGKGSTFIVTLPKKVRGS
ncbi:MAG: PAS domain-containing protein [Thermoanaerobacteraceae bacterium]|nr:PAS domain-containing protein [Thermoanaerobacteraceae bacterium]